MNSIRFESLIFAILGSIFTTVGIIYGFNSHSFVGKAIPAQGTVVDMVEISQTDNERKSIIFYYPVIEFNAQNGEQTTFESNIGSTSPEFTKGQQVEILYNPQKPKSAQINSWSAQIDSWASLWLIPIVFTGFGSFFLLVGGILLIRSLIRFKTVK